LRLYYKQTIYQLTPGQSPQVPGGPGRPGSPGSPFCPVVGDRYIW